MSGDSVRTMEKKKTTKRGEKRQISVAISGDALKRLRRIAAQEKRSISGQAEFFLCRALSRNDSGVPM